MTRSFSAVVAQTAAPDELRSTLEQQSKEACEFTTPRRDVAGRVRAECSGIVDVRSREDILELVDWAVVMEASDIPGHHARVDAFDGEEWIDEFTGYGFAGEEIEAYLERFHGILVDSAGPYLNSSPFDPALALAAEDPARVLVDSSPEPPFESAGSEYWVVTEAETTDPTQFKRTFVDNLQETGYLHDDTATPTRSWASNGPFTVEFVEPTADSSTRVRARVPLAFGGLVDRSQDGVGIDLPFGVCDFEDPLEWICFCYGCLETGRVTASLFAGGDSFYSELATDVVVGKAGVNGAGVAAYLRRYYGFDIDPTVTGVEMAALDTPGLTEQDPEEYSYEILDDHGIEYSPPSK